MGALVDAALDAVVDKGVADVERVASELDAFIVRGLGHGREGAR